MDIIKVAKKFMAMDLDERMNIIYSIIFVIMLLFIAFIFVQALEEAAVAFMKNPNSIRGYLIGYGGTLLIVVLLIWSNILGATFPNTADELPIDFHLKIKHLVFLGFGYMLCYIAGYSVLLILIKTEVFDPLLTLMSSISVAIAVFLFFWWKWTRPINKEIKMLRQLEAEHRKLKWRFWRKDNKPEDIRLL